MILTSKKYDLFLQQISTSKKYDPFSCTTNIDLQKYQPFSCTTNIDLQKYYPFTCTTNIDGLITVLVKVTNIQFVGTT